MSIPDDPLMFTPPGLEIRPRPNVNATDWIDTEWQLIRDGIPDFGSSQLNESFRFSNEGEEEDPLQSYYRDMEEAGTRIDPFVGSQMVRPSQVHSDGIPSALSRDLDGPVSGEDLDGSVRGEDLDGPVRGEDTAEEVTFDSASYNRVILYNQDKVDPYNPDQTDDSLHLSEEDFPEFVPLTFNTSIDLKQKLRIRNLIPPSQFPTDSQLTPKAEVVIVARNIVGAREEDHEVPENSTREEDLHDPSLFDNRSSSSVRDSNPKRQKMLTNPNYDETEDRLSEADNYTLTRERQQLQNSSFISFGLSDVAVPRFLNQAPRIGLSRLTRVKPLHKFNQS